MEVVPVDDKIYPSVVTGLPSLAGKCYAITGCTSGTGFWTAVAAARKGAACLLLLNRISARSAEAEGKIRAESSGGTKVVTVDCDLQTFSSVQEAATRTATLAADFGGLDGLVCNAGVMAVPDTRTPDGYDVQMQTNHLSHFLLTRLLLPSLEAAAAARGEARVVQHSSGARGGHRGGDLDARFFSKAEPGGLGGDSMGACFSRYHQTKLANPVFAMALHERLQAAGSKVKSLCAEPGVAATSLAANMTAGHKEVRKAAQKGAAPAKAKDKAAGQQSSPLAGMDFQPQSAADGACCLMEASFGSSANSGDFYMPGVLIKNTVLGMPVKCMTAGKPSPSEDWIAKRFGNEALTMKESNRSLLWAESEKATGDFKLKLGSKL